LTILLFDGENRFAVFADQILAIRILGEFRRTIGPGVRHGLILVVRDVDGVHAIVDGRAVGQMIALRALRVMDPVSYGDDGKHDQRADLNDVDRHVNASRAGHAAIGDVGYAKGKYNTEQNHEQRAAIIAAERVRHKLAQQITAENGRHPHHAAGINPIIQVARPAGEEFGHPRELVVR